MTSATPTPPHPHTLTPASPRLTALDQFRGYTVVGMLLVNFVGGFAVCPRILRHTHDYCSYADTIMPQFLFAAGFAMRLSFLKHLQHGGAREAWSRMTRRLVSLALVAIAWYSLIDWTEIQTDMTTKGWSTALFIAAKRRWMQTLLHITLTSCWILPVIAAGLGPRVWYAAVSGLLHVVLSAWFNFAWVNGQLDGVNGIDGGPLGFLTWSIPAIAGTWACDVCRPGRAGNLSAAARQLLMVGGMLAGLGWLQSCGTTIYDVPPDRVEDLRGEKYARHPVLPTAEEWSNWNRRPAEPPFVPPPDASLRKWNYWMMSQRAGSLSYLVFAAGFSLMIFAGFAWACELHGWRLGLFRTFGVNALAGYLLADLTSPIAQRLFTLEKTSPAISVSAAFLMHLTLTWLILRLMEWRKVFLRM